MSCLSHKSVLFLILIAATAIRFVGLGEKQLWIDEIIQVLHSRPDSIGEILKGVAQDRGGVPVDYVVQHYVMKAIAAPVETSARLHAALFGSISVALMYVLSFHLLKRRRIAMWATALYAVFPFHHHYSQEGRPYALFLMLVLALSILFIHARTCSSWTIVLSMSLCAAIGLYTHPFTAFFILALISINLFRLFSGKVPKPNLGFCAPLISGAIGTCLFVPWLLFSFKSSGEFSEPLSLNLIPEAIQGLGDGSYPVSIILLALASLGAFHLWKLRLDALTDLTCWIVVPIPLILFVLYWRSYFFAARQLIFITPAIVLLAAWGIERLLCRYGKKAMVVPVVWILLCLAVIVRHYPDDRIDFRSAGEYLSRAAAAGDRIVAPNSLGLLSFYFPAIYAHEGDGFEPGAKRLFFVDTQYASAAERGPLLGIQARMALRKHVEYRGISIHIFEHEGIE